MVRRFGIIKQISKAAQPLFSPVYGPFRVRVGVRDRVRDWVGSTPVPIPSRSAS